MSEGKCKAELWQAILHSAPPHCLSLAAPGESKCKPVARAAATGKDVPPSKEIKMNPDYGIPSASSDELNEEG